MSDNEMFDAIHAEDDDRLLADILRGLLADGNHTVTSWTGVPGVMLGINGETRVNAAGLAAMRRAADQLTRKP